MPSEMARLRTHCPLGSSPGQVIQERRRALVGARDVDQVAQVDRAVRRRDADDHVADGGRVGEEAGRIDGQVLRADFERAGGQRDVLRVEDVLQLRGIVSVLRQPLLRVVEINLLLQHAGARDRGRFRHALHGALDQVGVVVELRDRSTSRPRPSASSASVFAGSRMIAGCQASG